jgi:hypothetical protein
VFDRDGSDTEKSYFNDPSGSAEVKPRFAASRLGFPEHIGETGPHFFQGFIVAVDGKGDAAAEGPHIVKSVEMVRVGVGKQDSVKPFYACPDRLESEFWPCINDYALSPLPGDVNGRAHPLVKGVSRTAHGAGTGYHGDAVGGAGTEDAYFHAVLWPVTADPCQIPLRHLY